MPRKRKIISLDVPASPEELEHVLGQYADVDILIDAIRTTMDGEINAIRDRYESKLASLAEDRDGLFDRIQAWAEEHPDRFTARRSLDLVHATIGYRTGQPQVKPITRQTWASVLERLKAKAPGYVRTKESPDKEKLLADRAALDLRDLGLRVVQDESFYVVPRREPEK